MAVVHKTVVRCGVMCDHIVWPYFFEGNITGKCYTDCVLKEPPLSLVHSVRYQHDGAPPPHTSSGAVRLLDVNFP